MIRVAYDVSFTVPPPGMPAIVTGVGRVIEEQLRCLRVDPDLDVRVVGGFGGDWNPVITSLSAEKWASTVLQPPMKALKGYRTRSRVGEQVVEALYRCQKRANRTREKVSPAYRRVQDLVLAALRRTAHSCVDWGLGQNEIDVFHSTFRSPPDWLSPAVPRVVTIHDVIPLRFREEYSVATLGPLEAVLASLKPERDVVAAVSQYTKEDFCALSGFPAERVVVAPLSAGDRFRPVTAESTLADVRARHKLGTRPFVLSVSNPQPRKNIPLLIRSFYDVLRRLPSWDGNLVLVGNVKAGFGVKLIDQEIDKQPDLSTRIIRAGGVSDEDLCCLYSGCEAFLFPSSLEGFGLPVLEAMQCGAPVICSNTSSLPGVAGDAAVLVDPGDEAAIAQAIFDLLSNPDRRRELTALSFRRAAEFSWKASAEKVAEAYKMALNLNREPQASR
jgi:glycosyltransferase involved in cell wall biosynthesis